MTLFEAVDTCVEQFAVLDLSVQVGVELVLPLRSKMIFPGEPPWINPKLEDRRQRALSKRAIVSLPEEPCQPRTQGL